MSTTGNDFGGTSQGANGHYLTAEQLSQLLGGARQGNGFSACCPAHDDTTPSLAIHEKHGKVLVHCHAGCSQKDVLTALRDRGIVLQEPAETPHLTIVNTYTYRDESGGDLLRVVRFSPKGFRQQQPDGRGGWNWGAKGVRQVVYRLPEIAEAIALGKTIFVVEGEKDADRLAELGIPSTCNAGGVGKWTDEHSACLLGADLVIVPDNDEPGRKHADKVGKSLRYIASRVRVLDLPGLPEKGDVSDWLDAGGTIAEFWMLTEAAPEWRKRPQVTEEDRRNAQREEVEAEAAAATQEGLWVPDSSWLPAEGFKLLIDGSIAYAAGEDENGVPLWRWLCSPFEVAALTSDETRQGHGRLLRVFDQTNRCIHEWAMPASILAGDASAILGQLLDLGLRVALKPAKAHIADLIMQARPERIARCVAQTGWHGDAFVFPSHMIAKGGHFEVVLQARSAVRDKFMPRGTLEEWRQRVAAPAIGNSRLVLAIAGALVGPCLKLVRQDGGGLHFHGYSSTGKTTTLRCAGSVWGGSDKGGLVDNWRHTSNGLEAKAQAHSDMLLCLEELGQAQAETAIDSAYLLANGQGRGRMASDTAMRKTPRWRIFFMSDGEVTLEDRATELPKKKLMAGQIVRVINIAADAGKGHGLFDELNGAASARDVAEQLRAATQEVYGTAAPAFLERLVHDLDGATAFLGAGIDRFVATHAATASSQVQRVAQRFGLIAAVGALAVQYRVLPWAEEEAYIAAKRCFEEWLAARGTEGQIEILQGVAQVRRLLEAHGASRFTPWHAEPERTVYDRLGFVRHNGDESPTYHILSEGWREITKGFSPVEIAKAINDLGALDPDPKGKLQKLVRLPGMGPTRCYVIDFARLVGNEEEDEVTGVTGVTAEKQ